MSGGPTEASWFPSSDYEEGAARAPEIPVDADPTPVLALSIRQPWAHFILYHGKDVENRTWPTKVRGRICIHAAKTFGEDEKTALRNLCDNGYVAYSSLRIAMQYGAIIGTVEIVDCVDSMTSPWFAGPYGFVLRNPQPIEPIPCRGRLGFFDWRNQQSS